VEAVAYVRKDNDRRTDTPPVGSFRAHAMVEIMAMRCYASVLYCTIVQETVVAGQMIAQIYIVWSTFTTRRDMLPRCRS